MKAIIFAVVLSIMILSVALAADEQPAAEDPRLDEKVTYEAKGIVLHKALAELTEKTGVVMNCGKNQDDWEVRDRKVNIFVKDMPLRELQAALAKVLSFTWTKGKKDDVYTYRLFQDMKSRKEEDRLRAKAAEEQAKKQAEKRENAISKFERLDSLTPEEIEKLKDESPFLYMMAKEPMGKAMGEMIRNMPMSRDAFVAGREVSVDLSVAPPQLTNAAQAFVNGFGDLMHRINPGSDGRTAGLADSIHNARVSFRKPPDGMGMDAGHAGIIGMFEIEAEGHRDARIPLFDPTSPIANAIGRALLKTKEGASQEDIRQHFQTEITKAISELQSSPQEVEPLPEDPDFEKSVKLELAKPGQLGDVLEELAKKAELQIISDNFQHRPQSISKTEDKLGALLQSVCSTFEKKPEKRDKTLLLVDKRWAEKRSWEVPEDWLEYWREAIDEGTVHFEDIVDVACLTDEQLAHTIQSDEALRPISLPMMRNKEILRFYAVLTEAQQKLLSTEAGLDPATLADDQWPYYQHLLTRGGRSVDVEKPVAMVLAITDEGKSYDFGMVDRSPVEPENPTSSLRTWSIRLPAAQKREQTTDASGQQPPAEVK